MVDNTPRSVIQERFDRLREVVEKGAYDYNQASLGKTLPVLIEGYSKKEQSILTGRSPENITVHVEAPEGFNAQDYVGKILDVGIDEAKTWYLRGHFDNA